MCRLTHIRFTEREQQDHGAGMSKLLNKLVSCTDFPGKVGEIKKYDPNTGYMEIEIDGELRTVHISKCKIVKELETV